MFTNYPELNWYERPRDGDNKLKVCRRVLKSSTPLKNMSFHVVERTRTTAKRTKVKTAQAKRVKLLFFIVNHAYF